MKKTVSYSIHPPPEKTRVEFYALCHCVSGGCRTIIVVQMEEAKAAMNAGDRNIIDGHFANRLILSVGTLSASGVTVSGKAVVFFFDGMTAFRSEFVT